MKLIDDKGNLVYESPETFRLNIPPIPDDVIDALLVRQGRDDKGNHIDFSKEEKDKANKKIAKYNKYVEQARKRGEYI